MIALISLLYLMTGVLAGTAVEHHSRGEGLVAAIFFAAALTATRIEARR